MTKRKSEDFSDELKDQFKEGGCKPAATLLTEDEEKESFTEKRIRRVIEATLDEEIAYKKYELEKINERIFEAQNMLDKLRVCIICNFYSQNGRLAQPEYINHPAIKSLKCEHLEMACAHARSLLSDSSNTAATTTTTAGNQTTTSLIYNIPPYMDDFSNNNNDENSAVSTIDGSLLSSGISQQYEVKICVGNVSKFVLNVSSNEMQQQEQQQPTYKWMVYIRSPQCSRLENYIKKVIFFLHSSYKPNDIVEIKSPPFELTRRGWGEFPVQVQIHFKDARNKRIDVLHPLKLDWTQTGLQTFGGETSTQAKLILKPADFILDTTAAPEPSSSSKSTANTVVQSLSESNTLVNSNSSYLIGCGESSSLTTTTQPPCNIPMYTPQAIIQHSSGSPLLPPLSSTPSVLLENDSDSCSNPPLFNEQPQPAAKTSSSTTKTCENTNSVLLNTFISSDNNNLVKPSIVLAKPLNVTGLKQSVTPPTFADPKPAEIIYKVQPSDALIKQPSSSGGGVASTTNSFLSSLKPAQSSSSSVSNSMVSTADKSVVTPAIALATTIKRIKLSTDQLTKIKTSSSSFGVKSNPESTNLPTCLIKTEPTEEKPVQPESKEETCREENRALEEIPLVYSIQKLSSLCELTRGTTTSFETILKRLLPSCPLVDRSRGRELNATSMREYFSWPYGKRKAREWMRAVRLREMAGKLTSEVWSTKRIVLWLRAHGHTPLEYKSISRLNDNNDDDSTINQLAYVNSYSSIRRLFDYKRCGIKLSDDNEDESSKMTIDVVADDTAVDDTRRRGCCVGETKRAEIESIERERNPNEDRFGPIEMTIGERFIQEELFKLKVRTNTVNFAPSSPKDDDIVVPCPLVEMFMLAVYKRFAQDLIRRACADIYFVSSTPSTSTSSFESNTRRSVNSSEKSTTTSSSITSLGDLKFPASLNVKDIYRTIMRHDRYDFLTNKYMGVYVDNKDVSSSSSSSNGGGVGGDGDQANKSVQLNTNRIMGSKVKKNFSDSSLVNN